MSMDDIRSQSLEKVIEFIYEKVLAEGLAIHTLLDVVNQRDILLRALIFASSVIKSGEEWTDTCEEIIGGAISQAKTSDTAQENMERAMDWCVSEVDTDGTIGKQIGPNVKRLFIKFIARESIPPGGWRFEDGLEFFINTERRNQILDTAMKNTELAIEAIRSAPDNPYGENDEDIAEAILRHIEDEEQGGENGWEAPAS